MNAKKRVISLEVTSQPYFKFLEDSINLALGFVSSYVCVANVHMLVEASQDAGFSKIVNGADLVTPDGVPLAKSIKFFYGVSQDRVAGMDLLPDLLKSSEERGIKVFFFGGTDSMLDLTRKFCAKVYPSLDVVGMISPPFRAISYKEEESYIRKINSSGAGFVFVALGCPKQEKWMAAMKGRINACMIGIGGALPVMIGMQKRAPKWMQEAGLEWLFRLSQEPKRLFSRYFITNSVFLFLFLREWFKIKVLRYN
ncbi:WecB/TagA/CpsF family glycosyltransferase [Algoriphagus vanfongensis]|uniref:WecB/TagA/CpsF family glycosyltransferase n=1 Tax=Algoriphagus vanfongensis TaxID=426371 RepID=UPI0004269828|nr:WecB/TagA/CpsF family glycosyltransferase [Algoriphagus vanfongensis]